MDNRFSFTEMCYLKELVFGYDDNEVAYTNIDTDIVKPYKEANHAENSSRE